MSLNRYTIIFSIFIITFLSSCFENSDNRTDQLSENKKTRLAVNTDLSWHPIQGLSAKDSVWSDYTKKTVNILYRRNC